jgi:hypothetical protein
MRGAEEELGQCELASVQAFSAQWRCFAPMSIVVFRA